MNDFRVGIKRQVFNKNLKDAIQTSGLNYTSLKERTGINQITMSEITNFKYRPSEEQRVALAIALVVPIDDIFPEKYDELYDRISPAPRSAEIKIDFLRLTSPEVLALQAPQMSDQEAIERELQTNVEFELHKLPSREREIIEMRFGLSGELPKNLEEVGKKMGVTRERVRQMEAKALERMRTDNKFKELTNHI